MPAYDVNSLNRIFKHIMTMNGAEIKKELDALERMSTKLKPFLSPKVNDIEGLEEKVEEILRIYTAYKVGAVDDDAIESILDHQTAILAILVANACIGSIMIGYVNADDELIRKKRTASIETVATLYGNEEAEKTEDTEDIDVQNSAKASIRSNTQKFVDQIINGIKD